MKHRLLFYHGYGIDWYWSLYNEILSNHREIECTQGLGYESPSSLTVIIDSANSCLEAFSSVALPRSGDIDKKITFSLLYSLRRILGYHETVLFDKYPILRKYVPQRKNTFYAKSNAYICPDIPNSLLSEPWVSEEIIDGHKFYAIDQIGKAVYVLSDPKRRGSRTCLVDFGEGFKSRCIMSWLFIVREGELDAYNNVRSNDLYIGMPNDLFDIRLCQLILAACTGMKIGYIHHQVNLTQIYKRDIAGRDQVSALSELYNRWESSSNNLLMECLKRNTIVNEIIDILQPYIEKSVYSSNEGWERYQLIIKKLRTIFWSNNKECTEENRQSVRRNTLT